ncbi:MAG: peptide chain release factor-like protein [Candidatus Omnitrophica bacterium]|nr:peptide chain release factor-like protein [Candidatus Omnitrophota bacterium]
MLKGHACKKEEVLEAMMASMGISERDLEEKFVRARGRGGQKINKTSVCVYLKHRPSGIEVKCDKARSQTLNRFLARRLLLLKIDSAVSGKESEIEREREKIRRQKRRRSRRSKEKVLRDKKMHSEKKETRRRPAWE